MTLSSEQIERALELFDSGITNLNEITQTVFDNPELDGRHREGRAIRAALVDQGREYGTTRSEAEIPAELDAEALHFLNNSDRIVGMNPLEIARMIFNDDTIQSLSSHHRIVLNHLQQHRADVMDNTEAPAVGNWYNPKSLSTTLKRINKWAHAELGDTVDELTARHLKCVESLFRYLQAFKLESTLNSFQDQSDRDLFESEFIRATWDKPDLTNDELNLYMTVCSNYVRIKHIQARISSLNTLLQEQKANADEEARGLTIQLTERLKGTSDELNQTEKRIESLIQKLNGDRAKRKEKQMENNASFLYIVEEFQRKESRDRYLKIARLQNAAVKKETERLESVADIKARVFGIAPEELL